MNKIHSKSPCCNAVVYRFGSRRRQCRACKKTWRIRKKKRGRKPLRIQPNPHATVILKRQSIANRARKSCLSFGQIRLRHERNLQQILKHASPPTIPVGELIAIIDGWHFYLKGQKHVIYLILLRSVTDNLAVITEPVIFSGQERVGQWKQAFERIPTETRKRIKAVISDGITGIEKFAVEQCWVIQRCHFHLIATLQKLRGKCPNTTNRTLREEIYQTVLAILIVADNTEARKLLDDLRQLLDKPDCPYWFRRRVRGFFEQVEHFRSYLNHPELNLPITSNSAECVFQSVTEMFRLTRGFRSLKSFELWLRVQLRLKGTVKCNGKNFNQYY